MAPSSFDEVLGMLNSTPSPELQKWQAYLLKKAEEDKAKKMPGLTELNPHSTYVANMGEAINTGLTNMQGAMKAKEMEGTMGAGIGARDRFRNALGAAGAGGADPGALQYIAAAGSEPGMSGVANADEARQLKQTLAKMAADARQKAVETTGGYKLQSTMLQEAGKDNRSMPFSSSGNPSTGVATTNRKTGGLTTTDPVLNPNRPAGGAAAAEASISEETLANWATALRKTGKMPQLPRGIQTLGIRDAIVRKALEQDPSFDQATAAAGYVSKTTALNKLKSQEQMVGAFKETTLRNIKVLKDYIGKVPNLGSPALNRPARWAARQAGDKNVAAFEAALLTVQQEATRVLSTANATGIVTDQARKETERAISGADTPEQMIEVLTAITRDFENRSGSHKDAIKALTEDIGAEPAAKDGAAPMPDKAPAGMDAKRKAELESRY